MSTDHWTDCVVDIETTDTDPSRGHIIQIAAIKFNASTLSVCSEVFDRCLLPTPNRRWDEATRDWWMDKPELLNSIYQRMEPAEVVLKAFTNWCHNPQLVMWAKPTHFDYSFLASMYRDFGMQVPFNFRTATDQNSWLRGRYFPDMPPNWEKLIEFTGNPHNAIDDCWHQLKCIYRGLKKEYPT